MNKTRTQFWVALVAMLGVVLLATVLTLCVAFGGARDDVLKNALLLLTGGLINATGAAVAYLFRLNGHNLNSSS